ncbi:2-amino-4-hydroxy-6-hydroxymethyldihydropteridine diphosphokinase [Mesoaciditoga lauensis]|uniref:2-amino-4-hydroxy-6- hydroxymethyldihydropteridine diphosphokinase n=1 Tax=Mesoaciditoga lauensis TaxID=1495039 RepID=UPI00056AEE5C
MHTAYIAFGSNMGNRKEMILSAMEKMKENGMNFLKISTFYETKPYGVTDQNDFMNCVAEIETELTPMSLLDDLLNIEKSLGRVREKRWGPRTIDLDIIFYDKKIVNFANLIIPHPDLQNRLFVLEPLFEIAPKYVHPLTHKSVEEMLKELRGVSV